MRRSLDLTQIVPCVLIDGPSVSLLVTLDGDYATFRRDKDDVITILILNRSFIPVEQLEFGSGKSLGHIASFILHEIDAGN